MKLSYRNVPYLFTSVIIATSLVACGDADDTTPATPEVSTEDQALAAEQGAATAQDIAAAAEVSGPLGDVDSGVRDPIVAARDLYRTRTPCADVDVSRGELSVDFGTGCPVNGRTMAGAFTITATRGEGMTRFQLDLDGLVTDGLSRDGVLTVSGSSGQLATDLEITTSDGSTTTDVLYSGTMTAIPDGVGLEGTAFRGDGTTTKDLAYSGVEIDFGECYPRAGTVTVDSSVSPTIAVTFSSMTPTTGEVSVRVGMLPPQTLTLPTCPL